MTTVFETEDVYLWWKVKKALRNAHMTVYDDKVIGRKMFLEVADRMANEAKLIAKKITG